MYIKVLTVQFSFTIHRAASPELNIQSGKKVSFMVKDEFIITLCYASTVNI